MRRTWARGARDEAGGRSIEHAVVIRNPRVRFRRLSGDGGGVLLNLDTAAYHGLNETGTLIWECVGDGRSIDELTREVAARFDDAPPTLGAELADFVHDLVERDLLQLRDAASATGG